MASCRHKHHHIVQRAELGTSQHCVCWFCTDSLTHFCAAVVCHALLPLLQFNDQILQVFTSSLFLAGGFAALVGMVLCRKFGRRFTMILGGLAFCIGEENLCVKEQSLRGGGIAMLCSGSVALQYGHFCVGEGCHARQRCTAVLPPAASVLNFFNFWT